MYFKSSLLAILILVGFSGNAQLKPSAFNFKTVAELQQFLSYSKNRVPLISAHRGGPQKGFPENAIETFKQSAAFQPLIIECDIALSKDSALVLMHDNRLDRTSTGKGLIGDYTLSELQQFKLIDNGGDTTGFAIPLLDDALNWGKGKVIFTLDVKRGVPFAKVVEAVRRCKAEANSVIITYNATQAAEVHQLAPELMISVSIRSKDDLLRLNSVGVPDNRMVAFVGTSAPDKEVYDLLHEHKILCMLGVMGNLDKQAIARGDKVYYGLIEGGADMLSTDRANEAGVILQQYRTDTNVTSKYLK